MELVIFGKYRFLSSSFPINKLYEKRYLDKTIIVTIEPNDFEVIGTKYCNNNFLLRINFCYGKQLLYF